MSNANRHRGEASLTVDGQCIRLRPTFEALVAAEGEIGPLFALVDRAAEGQLSLAEIATLFDHVSGDRPPAITRARIGEAVVAIGLAGAAPVLRVLLEQILKGR